MSGKKLYTRDEMGGIRFNSGRKPGEVRIPNYVYDLWLPLIGTEAITVYAVYCRLERAEIVKAITMETIAKCCRMSKTTLGKLNDILAECGFIAIKKPEGNRRAHHMTNEITVNDPPQQISAELIAKYKPNSGYQPLSEWLCEVPDSTSHEVLPSTSRGTKQYHEEVPDSTSTMLQPSSLQPSSIEEKIYAPSGAKSPPKTPKKLSYPQNPKSWEWKHIEQYACDNPTIELLAAFDNAQLKNMPTAMYAMDVITLFKELQRLKIVSDRWKSLYTAGAGIKHQASIFKRMMWALPDWVKKEPPITVVPPPQTGEYVRPLSPAQLREKEALEKAESERSA